MEFLGIFLGMRYYYYLRRKSPEKPSLTISLSVIAGATAGALIGSKIIGNLENPYTLFLQPFSIKRFWMNNTIVGGLAFGLIGVELTKKLIHYEKSTGDLMVFPLVLAIIIGRIGCFFTGVYEETYGLPTNFIFGMHLGDQYLRHPVALYEIGFLLLLWLVLKRVQKKNFSPGFIFQLFMLGYFTFRFFLDFLKPRVALFGSLGTIQLTCLLVMMYYIYKINRTLKL
jgi:prolipoprotein diacylglyceryltransferase